MKENLTFKEKLVSSHIKSKVFKYVKNKCFSSELCVRRYITENDLNEIIEIAYSAAFLENCLDVELENVNVEEVVTDIIQCILDIVSKHLIDITLKDK